MSTGFRTALATEEFPDELPKQYEIVCGMLVRKAMPSADHSVLQFQLVRFLGPYQGRRNTPGGWWLGTECEIELFPEPDTHRYLPDVVGWTIAAVPERPRTARVRVWPQWVCEILSPSTADRDTGVKMDTYHRAHVDHYWVVDPERQVLTVWAWAENGYEAILEAGRGERVRAAPFADHELDLDWLFEFE